MTLEDLGYNKEIENYRTENGLDSFDVGRILAEHRERYVVQTAEKECDAEILGNLRYTAQSRSDFPAVGDWVAISEYDKDRVLIHSILPRKSSIERQSVGRKGEKQIIAANIDTAFIVQAVDRDFSINRIERYLAICNSSNVKPVIILTKIDLVNDAELNQMIESIRKRIDRFLVFAISNKSQLGIAELKQTIEKGKTYCLLGSSGVGKSTLLNTISGRQLMKTNAISEYSNRGRHVTTHREMQVLENSGIIIDNPGMRMVGIADSSKGLEMTFQKIVERSGDCKFKDCSHTTEIGCAILADVENGEIDKVSYENFLKMERENEHFESTVAEKRKKDKNFGKMIKHFKKARKSNKY